MRRGLFVTGTDTGVGKTLVSCALLHAYGRAGRSAVGMKPVAAGCEAGSDGRLRCGDVESLRRASNVRAAPELANPYAFLPPVAPHAAAAEAGIAIDFGRVLRAFDALAALADVVVVEGVGGFRVPLDEHRDTADLARLLGLPVVLVVGMRLGCLNHALLTQEAIAARGLSLAGWVANCIDPQMAGFEPSLDLLRRRIDGPLLGVLDYREEPNFEYAAGKLATP